MKFFPTVHARLWGFVLCTGTCLCLQITVVFLGCANPGRNPSSPEPLIFTQRQVDRQAARRAAGQIKNEARMKALVAGKISPRDAQAEAGMVDLTGFYNTTIAFQNTEAVRSIRPGTLKWNGVKFDVRAKVELFCSGPQGVNGIPIRQKCSRIYFLHGVERAWYSNSVSQFVVHFSGTNTATVPIVFGRDVAGELLAENKRAGVVPPPNLVAWQETRTQTGSWQPRKGFFLTCWTNPCPEQTVETIDFAPGHEIENAFLVAITVKP